jgi:hypothetical protein
MEAVRYTTACGPSQTCLRQTSARPGELAFPRPATSSSAPRAGAVAGGARGAFWPELQAHRTNRARKGGARQRCARASRARLVRPGRGLVRVDHTVRRLCSSPADDLRGDRGDRRRPLEIDGSRRSAEGAPLGCAPLARPAPALTLSLLVFEPSPPGSGDDDIYRCYLSSCVTSIKVRTESGWSRADYGEKPDSVLIGSPHRSERP